MKEYTSWEIGKKLEEMGFDEPHDLLWNMDGDEQTDEPALANYPRWKDSKTYPAYRSDTLLEWLLEHRIGVYIDKNNGKYYAYAMSEEDESATADSLPDCLGEVIIGILLEAKSIMPKERR